MRGVLGLEGKPDGAAVIQFALRRITAHIMVTIDGDNRFPVKVIPSNQQTNH